MSNDRFENTVRSPSVFNRDAYYADLLLLISISKTFLFLFYLFFCWKPYHQTCRIRIQGITNAFQFALRVCLTANELQVTPALSLACLNPALGLLAAFVCTRGQLYVAWPVWNQSRRRVWRVPTGDLKGHHRATVFLSLADLKFKTLCLFFVTGAHVFGLEIRVTCEFVVI